MLRETPRQDFRAVLEDLARHCSYKVERITPETAQEWIDRENRAGAPPRHDLKQFARRVAVYERIMANGGWVLNGDPIVLDRDGRLVDGLARLHACVESGKPFTSLVVRGVDPKARNTVGAHLRRSTADILDINGEVCAREIASAWPIAITYLQAEDRSSYAKLNHPPATPTEMMSLTEKYPQMRDSTELCKSCGACARLGFGLAPALHFMLRLAGMEKADEFMRIVGEPGLAPDSAPATLRTVLDGFGLTTQEFRMALAIMAWNRFLAGLPISSSELAYNGQSKPCSRGGTRKFESFPTLDGVPDDLRIDMTGVHGERRVGVRSLTAAGSDGTGSPISMSIVYVTPAKAAAFLDRNGPSGTGRNRKLRKGQLERLGRDMQAGLWIFNGQPLKFTTGGRMIDGQHRCSGSVWADTGFVTFIVEGLDEAVFGTFDGGQEKNLGRHMRSLGMSSPTSLGAAVGMLHRILTGRRDLLSVGEGLALQERHPELSRHVCVGQRDAVKLLVQPSVATSLSYLFSLKDPAASKTFFDDLARGEMLKGGDPMLLLRKTLMSPKLNDAYKQPEQKAKIVIQTWNARRTQGKGTKRLKEFVPFVGYPEIL